MKLILVSLACLQLATGSPWVLNGDQDFDPGANKKRAEPTVRQPLFLSKRPNTGAGNLNPSFDHSAQYVDVGPGSGHEFREPGPNDQRGPCPGLNAAANHGFIPRNGILNTAQVIAGLKKAFNAGLDFSVVTSALGIAYAGDLLTGTWSIGGSYTPLLPSIPLLNNPPGLLGTHNKYEGDGSPTRGDAFLNGGNTNAFSYDYFTHLYKLGTEYTHDILAAQAEYSQQYSKQNDPYYFLNPIASALSPVTHGLIVNMMSNHSAEKPGGVLTRDVLKSFYSVQGEPGNFEWIKGHERIPLNWFKRPDDLTLVHITADVEVNNAMYPGQVSLGGNTGTVNSFAGVDLGNLTGGVFNVANLFKGNNLACFLLLASQQAIPGQLSDVFNDISTLIELVASLFSPILDNLKCPELKVFRKELFAPFPGAQDYLS